VWQSCLVIDPFASVTKWLTVPEVAETLNIPLGKVRRLIEEHHLVAVKRDGVAKVPAELIVEGETLPSLPGTIVVLLDAGFTLDGAIEWLYKFDDSLPGTPIEFLLKGHKSAVRRLAMSLAI
jgi:excisionase family DNA binding protein